MGGSVPLGYDSKDKKLIVNPSEAKTVRMIFGRYLALQSFQKLIDELNKDAVVTKARHIKGKMSGGFSFTYGPLAYLLKNRTYLGESGHKGSWFPGEHEPIVDRDTFEHVQNLLKANSVRRTGRHQQTGALLTGLLYDDRGNRMSPSFSVKNGVRYPFYVSSAVLKGRNSGAGSVARVSAVELEAAVLKALHQHVDVRNDDSLVTPKHLIDRHVARIVVGSTKAKITLKQTADGMPTVIDIPRSKPQNYQRPYIEDGDEAMARAPNPQLVQAVVRAHTWVRLLSDGTHKSIESLAQSARVHPKIIRNGIRMAFLAPTITKAILDGEQPPSLSLKDFIGAVPLSWSEQRRTFKSK